MSDSTSKGEPTTRNLAEPTMPNTDLHTSRQGQPHRHDRTMPGSPAVEQLHQVVASIPGIGGGPAAARQTAAQVVDRLLDDPEVVLSALVNAGQLLDLHYHRGIDRISGLPCHAIGCGGGGCVLLWQIRQSRPDTASLLDVDGPSPKRGVGREAHGFSRWRQSPSRGAAPTVTHPPAMLDPVTCRRTNKTVYSAKYHLIWCPKYVENQMRVA